MRATMNPPYRGSIHLKILDFLICCFDKYNNNKLLLEAIDDLKNATNDYIDLCINIIATNPKLKRQRDLL